MNSRNPLQLVFYTLLGIFIVILSYFIIPFSDSVKQALFPVMAILAAIWLILGTVLIVLVIKSKVKGKQKLFLIATGSSAILFLLSNILHNVLYGLAILTKNITILHYSFEALHVLFFIIAIIVCPLAFLIGAIGSIVLFIRV